MRLATKHAGDTAHERASETRLLRVMRRLVSRVVMLRIRRLVVAASSREDTGCYLADQLSTKAAAAAAMSTRGVTRASQAADNGPQWARVVVVTVLLAARQVANEGVAEHALYRKARPSASHSDNRIRDA